MIFHLPTGSGSCAEPIVAGNCAMTCPSASSAETVFGHLNLYREIQRDDAYLEMNYLCTLFQKELALAVHRLLANDTAPTRVFAARA